VTLPICVERKAKQSPVTTGEASPGLKVRTIEAIETVRRSEFGYYPAFRLGRKGANAAHASVK
jgi:hypothetical protein